MKVSGETLYQLAESAGYKVEGDGWWDQVRKGPGVEIFDLEIISPVCPVCEAFGRRSG